MQYKEFIEKKESDNSYAMSKVLSKANYDKVEAIIMHIEKNGQITPREAKKISKKSVATVRRYLKMLVETGCVEAQGKTNNSIYKIP